MYYISTIYDYHDKLFNSGDLVPEIVGIEEKTKISMEIRLRKVLREETIDLESKIQSEITNGRQMLKNEYPIKYFLVKLN